MTPQPELRPGLATEPVASDRPYLWDPWRTAVAKPDRPAVVADGDSCTFTELTSRSDQLALGLRSIGLGDDPIVSTDMPVGFRFFALALAALRYGFRLFPVGPALPRAVAIETLLRQSGSDVHVGSTSAPGLRSLSDDQLVDIGMRESQRSRELSAPRAGSLIFTTSGTTGAPCVVVRARPWYPYKGVAVLAKYAAGITAGAHIMANASFHLGTLGPALYALQAGSTVVVLPNWSPDRIIEFVDKYHADSAFLSPRQLTDLVRHGHWSAHKPRVIFHGGSPCAPLVKRAAIELTGPVLHEYYGTSQGIISEISSQDWLRHPGSVGRPLRGVRVSVRDGGIEQSPGQAGEIFVQFRAIDREGSVEALAPTGDAGYLDGEGYLHILGRTSGAGAWRQAQFEHEVRILPGIAEASVFTAGLSGETICYAEFIADHPDDQLSNKIHEVAMRHGLKRFKLELRPFGTFPRTPSGKIQRAGVQARLDDGS
jgi:long-chain acyl-CoA synthetase